jgi:long-chain acyl-CoA synthetase
VPRFFEKIQARVLDAVRAGSPVKKALFFWAKELGEKRRLAGFRPMGFQDRLADSLVYRKFRARLGGRVRFCVSGGAPLAKEIAEFFADLGVMIYEGYGLTETSPVISVNREGRFKFGTVGVPLDGVQVRITEDGEICTRSASVMKGYWNKPEETAAVLRDGWFCTGDLGAIDKDGFLSITGRKKELIVTSGGKKVPTRSVEELIEKDPYILRCVLFGEGRKFLTALIVPDKERLLEYAAAEKIAYRGYEDLLGVEKVHRFLEARIEDASKELANYEKIKYFTLRADDFTQASGELTPTLKVKRDVVLSRHRDALAALYPKEGA